MNAIADSWAGLRRFTAARIALGRAGGSLPTAAVLDFAAAHAAARDAVHSELDAVALARDLAGVGLAVAQAHSLAADRVTYLRRPDLGRRLDAASREAVATPEGVDVAIILADGLSAVAAQRHGPALVGMLVSRLQESGLRLGPIVIVRQGRVAIEDEIGEALGAAVSVILIGERPGLSAADSLGAYLVYNPRVGNTDSTRNCVSNIRPDGLALGAAAETIWHLVTESLRRKLSGIGLKDERGGFASTLVSDSRSPH